MTDTLFQKATVRTEGFRDVEPQDLARAIEAREHGVRVVDVREPHEWTGELGHVAAAELVPLATVEGAAAAWDRAGHVLLICRSGKRSVDAAQRLVGMGFTHVMNLRGGMLGWNEARLPVERA